MAYFKFTFNGQDYEGRATSRNTRSGFAHDIVVHDSNYNDVCTASMHYLNRTWECFQYESVLHHAIWILTERAISGEIDDYKEERGIKRLPRGKREEIERKWHEEYKKALETIVRL